MNWLSRIFGKRADSRQQPEAKFVLTFDGIEVTLRNPDDVVRRLNVADLGAVIIETNDTGPRGMDVWWALLNRDGKLGLIFPQGATGEKPVVDWLMKLSDFDHEQMIQAMSSTQVAVFPVWRKPPAPQI